MKDIKKRLFNFLKKVREYFGRLLNRVLTRLRQVPGYAWLIVLIVAVAETLFWVPLLQQDSMIWSIPGDWQDAMWIPELGLTYRDCFIGFMGLEIVGFNILVVLIVWLVYRYYQEKKTRR